LYLAYQRYGVDNYIKRQCKIEIIKEDYPLCLITIPGNRIIQLLLKEKDIRSSELQIKSGVAASKFHIIIKGTTCMFSC
jgi:hypothetical protein